MTAQGSNDASVSAPAPAPATASAALPPALASMREQTVDDFWTEMNRMPLFMTNLDDAGDDGNGGENMMVEALKALAYEGTRAEVAANFREQGNEQARAKKWSDAQEFYTKAIGALRNTHPVIAPPEADEAEHSLPAPPVDEQAEASKEKELEEACLVNRALCNLEKKNYRSCILDCASTIRLNPANIKAWYRSASACLALDKLPEALDACERGLAIDASNAPLTGLRSKIIARQEAVAVAERKRQERLEREASERRTLSMALQARNILTRTTDKAPEMEDADIKLAEPLDAASLLSLPVILLYPLHAQSDFIKAFNEDESLAQHLEYILPLPWDQTGEYRALGDVECYIETVSGGLIKAGKKLPLLKILGSGKVEVVDKLIKVNVVPVKRAAEWIAEFKKRRPQT